MEANSSILDSAALKLQIAQFLADDLAAVNAIIHRQLKSPSAFTCDISEHVSRFAGKQIRPILVLLCQRLLAEHASDSALRLGAAVEMIHMATLVHDDVIDEAETRRHVSTVHRRWNTETSVLYGDYLFSKSFHLAATTGDAHACELIGRATDRTCEGELNQIAARLDRSLSELDYFRIIRDKTGQLFALACRLGTKAAHGTPSQIATAAKFGMRLGMAFQIADDIMDLTQSQATTGKDSGNDLQNRRLTLPLLRAIPVSKSQFPSEWTVLNEIATGDGTIQRSALLELQSCNLGMESAAETAAELIRRAIRDLHGFPASHARHLLEGIARFAVRRQS